VALDLNEHSAWRLELARRYIRPYAERTAIAVLGGSVAQGIADRWSDVDTTMVEANLAFTPSWIYDGMGRDRGDLVVFYEYVLATIRSLVGVLAGLNRVYVAPEKLKRVGAVVARMEIVPTEAAARLEALLDLPREEVRAELDDLVGRTLDLVDEHLPEVDTARARRRWSLPAEPSDGV
jgi:hypothetical protein